MAISRSELVATYLAEPPDDAADIIVSGSAIFDGREAAANAAFMLDRVRQNRVRPAVAIAAGGGG